MTIVWDPGLVEEEKYQPFKILIQKNGMQWTGVLYLTPSYKSVKKHNTYYVIQLYKYVLQYIGIMFGPLLNVEFSWFLS